MTIIGTIRKHSTWLWLIIIAAIIVTFVIWGTPNQGSGGGGGGGGGEFGSINGRQVTRTDFNEARRETFLRYFFSSGEWPDLTEEQMMRDTYLRLLLIRKQAVLGIHVSNETIAKIAADILRSVNQGNPLPLDAFANQILKPRGLTEDDFARFIQHDLGIQQMVSSVGVGGKLVTPQEVRTLYEREHEEVSAQAAFFSVSNHLDEVVATPEAIALFYESRTNNYWLPERVLVTYVQFPASNFLAEAEQELAQTPNLAERIETTYQRVGGTNFFRQAKSPDEARQLVREQFLKDLALVSARRKASEFAAELYSLKPVSPDNLGKLASEKGLDAQLSEPFDRQYPPSDLKVRSDFVKQAFALTTDDPFAGPIVGEDTAFVIARNKTIPSEIPPLEQLRQRVTDDFKLDRARTIARQDGAKFAAMLAAGIPNGRSFSSLCNEAKVQPVLLPPFSLSTRSLPEVENHVNLFQFKQAAFGTAPGKPGEFVPTDDGGFVVFVQSKLPLDQARMNADLPRFTASVQRARENEAFNRWFSKEAESGLRDTPLARLQSAAGGALPQ